MPGPVKALTGWAFLLMGAIPAQGHPALYHTLEVDLRDAATVTFFFSVHAPELPSAMSAGVDPLGVDPEWLGNRTTEELSLLLEEAGDLLDELYVLSLADFEDAGVGERLRLPLIWETPEQLHDPAHDNGLPPGCFLVTASMRNPGAPRQLVVRYSETADKRLLLSVFRPGGFPKVRDLAPGDLVRIDLPKAPVAKQEPQTEEMSHSHWSQREIAVLIGAGAVVFGFLLFWWLRRCREE